MMSDEFGRLKVQYCHFECLSAEGAKISSYYTVSIFDLINKANYGVYESFQEMTDEVNRENIFKIIANAVCSSFGFFDTIERHNGLWFNGDWLPLAKEVTGDTYEFQEVIFDDFVVEYFNVWSFICQHCTDVYDFDPSLLDLDAATGMCGVRGCSNQAVHYIDFPQK